MRRVLVLLIPMFAGLACSSTPDAPPAEAPLPASIESAVRSRYPGQRVLFCESRPTAAGGRVHAVTLDKAGLRTLVTVDDAGAVLTERAELRFTDVPPAIRGSVRKHFRERDPHLVIRWQDGGSVRYEVRMVDTSGLSSSLQLTEGGVILEDLDGEGVPAGR
jgi:hypothetical protein